MINRAIETGQQNLSALENTIIKDSTIFPGEWYGGAVQFDPAAPPWPKTFTISVVVGSDVHDVAITEALPKS